MKAGILTYHFAKNYGALLQCYALETELQRQNVDVQVLNYVSPRQADNNALYSRRLSPKKMLKNTVLLPFHFFRKKRYDAFSSFLSAHLSLTRWVSTLEELKALTDEGYDLLISGSDQVFNPQIEDFEEAFFLPFETPARKTSFAASLGRADAGDLQKYRGYLADFSCLTVREHNAVPVLNQLGITVDAVAADPVFLLEKQEWEKLIRDTGTLPKSPYLFCYFLDAKNAGTYLKTAKKLAGQKGLKLINIVTRYRPSLISRGAKLDVGPEAFLGLLANADYVCTDSFHGTAFAILLNTDFSTFVPSANATDQRKQNLAESVGLKHRIVYAEDQNVDSGKIDYAAVNDRVADIRNKSRQVLSELLHQNGKSYESEEIYKQ